MYVLFNNWPITKLSNKTRIMALNTKVFPNKVVMTTVSKAPIPNVAIDLCHMIIPGMVANKHRIRPIIGNTYVTKATATSTIVPIIIALGCTFENTFATPILFDYNVYFNLYIQIKQMC